MPCLTHNDVVTPSFNASAVQQFQNTLPHALDDFQLEAIEHIASGASVVVCAPTGAGKTVIAEFAAHQAIDKGVKLFYTTPLKALSNQKYHDFKKLYGDDNVGMLTGDLSVNRHGRIVVMTTEVYRNMLYGIAADSDLLDGVGYVVLDECHYMNDAQRGTVWEESIIYCPRHVQIIALSATVSNAKLLTRWIDHVHRKTMLVESDFRPVPLRFSYWTQGEHLLPLFEAPGRMNKKLKLEGIGHVGLNKGRHKPKGSKADKKAPAGKFRVIPMLEALHERNMLPAIMFAFSRADCDRYLRETGNLSFLSTADKLRLKHEVDSFLEQNPVINNHPLLPYIRNGFASHHAGLLPALKMLVEHLFQQGLIRAVFATETLAAGINMPARTTVITAISKRTDSGHRMLTASEFLQMSGRAGRRGMDETGYVVVVYSAYESAQDAAMLASSPANALSSQFTPTYGMVLNLLQQHSLDEAQFLIRKSFGQFTAAERAKPYLDELAAKRKELEACIEFDCPVELERGDFRRYLKIEMMHKLGHKHKHTLHDQLDKFGKLEGNERALATAIKTQNDEINTLKRQMQDHPCHRCKVLHKHRRAEEKIHKLKRQVHGLEEEAHRQENQYWLDFYSLYKLLAATGYVDKTTHKPTAWGQLTAQLRTENEWFLGEVIQSGIWEGLPQAALAGFVCALVNDSNRKIDERLRALHPSPELRGVLREGFRLQRRASLKQADFGIETPVIFSVQACGLVESWAQGLDWAELMAFGALAEGDTVRLVRRTADVLRQLAYTPGVPDKLAETAKWAHDAIYRDPVTEVEMTPPTAT
ncbi:MAG: DEAD/DEAH box helicase [Vampirovibrionales bacterium]|nr:DEAD/DEAH box helicase [Vampirovibrionales bacterium]